MNLSMERTELDRVGDILSTLPTTTHILSTSNENLIRLSPNFYASRQSTKLNHVGERSSSGIIIGSKMTKSRYDSSFEVLAQEYHGYIL
jgi:hypothetical protein